MPLRLMMYSRRSAHGLSFRHMQRGQNVVVDDCWGTSELVKLLLVRTDDSTADGGDAPTSKLDISERIV